MKLQLAVVVMFLALTGAAACAQGGLYINPIAIRISNSVADTGNFAFLGQNSTSQVFYGANVGAYYDVLHAEKVNVSFDMRDSVLHANNASLNNFLIGLRAEAKIPGSRLKPYVQGSVGAGTSKAPTSSIHISRVEYGVFGGLDYVLNKHIDLRAVEIGYSALETASSQTIGDSSSIPTSKMITFGVGLVFRLP